MTKRKGVVLSALALLALAGCGGGSSGGSSGNHHIYMDGGYAVTGNGGGGGYIEVTNNGSAGIHVVPYGTIDTSFTPKPQFSTDFGTESLIVSADLTVDAYDTQVNAQAVVPDGGYYTYLGSRTLWRRNTAGGDLPVTGIHVQPNATLTLGLNWNTGGNSGADEAYIIVARDIQIDGTVTVKDLTTGDFGIPATYTIDTRHGTPATTGDMGALYLSGRRLLVTSTGLINTAGSDGALARGGDGGYVYAYFDCIYFAGGIDASGGDGDGDVGGDAGVRSIGSPSVYLYSSAWIVVTGPAPINASGGSGTTGGTGCECDIYSSNTHCWNTKPIHTDGGSGTTNYGGDAGDIYLEGEYGMCCNSGDCTANGGSSVDGNGGDGGYLYLYSGYYGDVINTGDFSGNGGASVNATGGDADYFEMYAYSGDIRNTGDISLHGGDGSMSSGTDHGGNGGYVYLYSDYDSEYYYGDDYPPIGDIQMSGDVDLRGGSGYNGGGTGGYVYVYADGNGDGFIPTQNVELIGYSNITMNGGEGASGGDGGYIDLSLDYAYAYGDYYMPVGPVEMTGVTIDGSGGTGLTATGGSGGYIYYTTNGLYAYDENSIAIYDCDATLNGGDGATSGGNAAFNALEIYGYTMASASGTLNANGGNGTGTDAFGGDGGGVVVASAYDVDIAGTYNLYGGDATGTADGGSGGYMEVDASMGNVDHSAHIYAPGGNSVDGPAGDGDTVYISSMGLTTVIHGGTCDVSGGMATGTGTDGTDGNYYIDYMLQ